MDRLATRQHIQYSIAGFVNVRVMTSSHGTTPPYPLQPALQQTLCITQSNLHRLSLPGLPGQVKMLHQTLLRLRMSESSGLCLSKLRLLHCGHHHCLAHTCPYFALYSVGKVLVSVTGFFGFSSPVSVGTFARACISENSCAFGLWPIYQEPKGCAHMQVWL